MSESKPDMPSPQNREEALFQVAVQLTGAERAAFLNGACLGDPALRQRLEALLAAHDAPDELSPKDKPAAVATMKLEIADAPDEAVGQTLGRYKLLERVGEGGCGVVYVAEQTSRCAGAWRSRSSSWAWTPSRSSPGSRRNGRRWR